MGLQKYFLQFNTTIKMDYDEKAELAEKRDTIINKLKADEDLPIFDSFNQGSYGTYTGVAPLDKDYDIDVGLKFKVSVGETKAYELKKKVNKILENHTDYGSEIKEPCVTVTYKKNGEEAFHVDLAIYGYEDGNDTKSDTYLSRGDVNCTSAERFWEPSGTDNLVTIINNRFDEKDLRDQYRRIIRYIKRWKNLKFDQRGTNEPPSIGIALLAEELFEPCDYDYFQKKLNADDLQALISFIDKIINKFVSTYNEDEWADRIIKKSPVQPNNDVFEKMTNNQMSTFKDKLETLLQKLNEVQDEPDIIEQCKKLRKVFGEDFPEADVVTESKKQSSFISSSSTSGSDDIKCH